MAVILLSTFLFALQITFDYTEAMPTVDVIRMPDDCRNQTFCTKDTDYPQDVVDFLLRNKTVMSLSQAVNPNDFPPKIGDRQWTDKNNEIYPCAEVHERHEIRYIIDEKNNVRVVAQSLDRFRQYIPIIRCKSPKPTNETNMVKADLAENYENNIECKEDKLNFSFVVLSPNLKSLEIARVKGGVPVGCQCRYVE